MRFCWGRLIVVIAGVVAVREKPLNPVSALLRKRLSVWSGSVYFGRGNELGDDGAGAAGAESRRSLGASVFRPKPVDQRARLSRAGLAAPALGRYLKFRLACAKASSC